MAGAGKKVKNKTDSDDVRSGILIYCSMLGYKACTISKNGFG